MNGRLFQFRCKQAVQRLYSQTQTIRSPLLKSSRFCRGRHPVTAAGVGIFTVHKNKVVWVLWKRLQKTSGRYWLCERFVFG